MSARLKVNVGCGRSPTPGWKNFDNSLSLLLARSRAVTFVLEHLRGLTVHQLEYIRFARSNEIERASALAMPLSDGSADAVYSSHMLEHLDRSEARLFLLEAKRILRSGGVIRIAVPDLRAFALEYLQTGDADLFLERLYVTAPSHVARLQRFSRAVVGERHHRWMYDAASLCRLLASCGFIKPEQAKPGETSIPDPGHLDLHERQAESVYVEALRP